MANRVRPQTEIDFPEEGSIDTRTLAGNGKHFSVRWLAGQEILDACLADEGEEEP